VAYDLERPRKKKGKNEEKKGREEEIEIKNGR